MEARLNYKEVAPGAPAAVLKLEEYVKSTGLESSLLDLVKTRASQINGCAWCLDMHTKDARAGGETEQRLYALSAWRETPFYTPRERAALAWTEAVTLVSQGGVPDDVYDEARCEFSEKELVDLTMAIVAINGWNRLNVAFRTVPGDYRPAKSSMRAASVV
ncbi:MAG: carboxymuconolactone decarboxylase family protein [Nitrososphaerota archaeon]|nr:carboxymuconolactone decarboxylase family protein [Nitrososphaerota archaeon]MDG7023926.1 carboxymuconolactone decarboxylase family protein [Nitrososphaerota archaeon]